MASLEFKNVSKSYTEQCIIDDVSLRIEDGEFAVIVGASGCGKSTLLRMVAGLENVSAGSILIDGIEVNRLEPKDRNIAMVFQNYALYPHMNVFDNMAYGLRMRGHTKTKIKQRVHWAAEILGLEDYLQRRPKDLSGGQRQRVAMGRAIVRKPKIFLFDEPLSNLDAKLRVQMRMEIKRLQTELGITCLYVTHDQVEAMTLADHLIVLNKGRVEQNDLSLKIYQQPASTFVAGFIGSPAMNLIKAKVNQRGDAIELSDGILLPLNQQNLSHLAGQTITLGIRPEHIFETVKRGADQFQLQIKMIEAIGSDTIVYGRLPCDTQTLTARLSGKWTAQLGDVVTLAVMPDSLHLFEEQGGQRISLA